MLESFCLIKQPRIRSLTGCTKIVQLCTFAKKVKS